MYVQFSWFQWVHFIEYDRETKLARWLVPAKGIGSGNCHWILPISCHPIARSTVFLIADKVERAQHTMNMAYSPELDVSDKLNDKDTTLYQELIGILRWATEIGRVGILLEVSLLSQHQVNPREGQLVQLLHIFAFLKKHPKLALYLSHELPCIDYIDFTAKELGDFAEIYREQKNRYPIGCHCHGDGVLL